MRIALNIADRDQNSRDVLLIDRNFGGLSFSITIYDHRDALHNLVSFRCDSNFIQIKDKLCFRVVEKFQSPKSARNQRLLENKLTILLTVQTETLCAIVT